MRNRKRQIEYMRRMRRSRLRRVTALDFRRAAIGVPAIVVHYDPKQVRYFDNRSTAFVEDWAWGSYVRVAQGTLYPEYWRESEKGPVCDKFALFDE